MKTKIGLMVLVLCLGFSLKAAAEDCYRECMQLSGCWNSGYDSSAFCSDTGARCTTDCRNKPREDSYGAIAYSAKDGSYGYSYGQSNKKQAEKIAMKYCKQQGKGCEIMVWFSNSCGAVAADTKKSFLGKQKVGWGQNDSESAAKQQALKRCKKSGGKNCEIQVSYCS